MLRITLVFGAAHLEKVMVALSNVLPS